MMTYKCPACGSEIEVTDTMLYNDNAPDLGINRVRLDTAIVHKEMIMSPDCAILFRMFSDEQQKLADDVIKRAMAQLSPEEIPEEETESLVAVRRYNPDSLNGAQGWVVAIAADEEAARRWIQNEVDGKHPSSHGYAQGKSVDWWLEYGTFKLSPFKLYK